jgi:hypothetical protein
MTKKLTEAQLSWNRMAFKPKPSPAPRGKIAPRNCHPEVIGAAENSTGPLCLRCGGPRGRKRGLHCDECRP